MKKVLNLAFILSLAFLSVGHASASSLLMTDGNPIARMTVGNPTVSVGKLNKGLAAEFILKTKYYNATTNRVDNRTPYNNHGTNNGGTVAGTDGFDFDGNDDYISIPNNNALNVDNAFTIATWAQFDAVADSPSIYTKHEEDDDTGYLLQVWNSKLLVQYGDGGGGWPYSDTGGLLQSDTALSNGTWYHIAVTRSGANVDFYVNGENDGSITNAPSGNISNNTTEAWIGGDVNLTGSSYDMEGKLTKLKIYKRVLAANEVKSLYDQGR